jgi:hypothetical protein
LSATRATERIKIDGLLDETLWQQAAVATDFVENDPQAGALSPHKTRVRVLYTDLAIFIGAEMLEPNPDSVSTQYNLRDRFDNTDWFQVIIDGYRDGNIGFGFGVSSVGVQRDGRYQGANTSLQTDWDAVWNAETRITPHGWIAEIEIPLSMIRFNGQDEQVWHINFQRFHNKARTWSFWNHVDPGLPGVITQCGLLTNMQGIRTAPRIQAFPYASTNVGAQVNLQSGVADNVNNSLNAGMDIKVGLSDAFTLDMALVPDFGQVRFDDQVLNLTPFEVFFNENRPFFTEGAELFNKQSNLFYSRRIGARPINYFKAYQSGADVQSVTNPGQARLLNATKISGRTARKTGLGFFNAIELPTYATLEYADGRTEKFETAPLTNFNVVVVDQTLPNNSNFNFTNAYVWRQGATYDANNTGVSTQLRDKANDWSVAGGLALSNRIFTDSIDRGHRYNLSLARTSGKVQGGVYYNKESYNFNPNDLGFLFAPNEKTLTSEVSYRIFQPTKRFNSMNASAYVEYRRADRPDMFTAVNIGSDVFFLTRKIFAFGGWVSVNPWGERDIFEPRRADFSRYYQQPASATVSGFISTDWRKRFAIDINTRINKFDETGRWGYQASMAPRFRPSGKHFIVPRAVWSQQNNDIGFITKSNLSLGYPVLDPDAIVFGRRQFNTFSIEGQWQYTINNVMGISVLGRYYWATAQYLQFENLNPDGSTSLSAYTGVDNNTGGTLHDQSTTFYNFNMVYQWRFMPGTDLFFTINHSIYNSEADIPDFARSAEALYRSNQGLSAQLKCIFFVDYMTVRSAFSANRNRASDSTTSPRESLF